MDGPTGVLLKKLAPNAKSFIANGKTYHIEPSMSASRWWKFLRDMPLVTIGLTFENLYKKLNELYVMQNQMKFADAAVITHNMLTGIKDLDENRFDPACRMCALFINGPDEDRRFITKEIIDQKMIDWFDVEGYDPMDFFTLALHSIPGYIDAYKAITQDTSHQTVKEGRTRKASQ